MMLIELKKSAIRTHSSLVKVRTHNISATSHKLTNASALPTAKYLCHQNRHNVLMLAGNFSSAPQKVTLLIANLDKDKEISLCYKLCRTVSQHLPVGSMAMQ
jgi:hypothetical protein